jgi:hypothetical protein
MTDKASGMSAAGGLLTGFIATLASSALVSGLAGLALNRGFGVSIPFLAGFFLIVAFLFFVRLVALVAAGAWHNVAIEAASRLAAGTVVGMAAAQAVLESQNGGVK